MFHFPGCPPIRLWIHLMVTGHYPSRVPPFGNLRINAYLRLPSAYRSLSRPSSAISAMASTLRSCSLDLASSRHSLLPKTTESSEQLRLLLFVSSLCSFQGASPAVPSAFALFSSGVLKFQLFSRSFKTIQKSSFQTQVKFPRQLRWLTIIVGTVYRFAGLSGFLHSLSRVST